MTGRRMISRDSSQGLPLGPRLVPWRSLVSFHKEVVKRAEEGLFSLSPAGRDLPAWTYLDAFEPEDLSGPWSVPEGSVRSAPFVFEQNQNPKRQVFLGGPGFLAWRKGDGRGASSWIPCWRPLLYREASLERDPEGGWKILPEQGAWHFSPLVMQLLERRNVALASDPEKAVALIVERATAYSDGGKRPFSCELVAAFLQEVPDLEAELTKKPDPQLRATPWVLFSAPTTFGPIVQHLMRDYTRLEEALSADPDSVGGLDILEGGERTHPSESTAEPAQQFVPLDPAQKVVVTRMLGKDPLTVVSGPPGCGKSQVVVSTLLNAWSRGQTVLFASNNNKAVDVVLERLLRFEGEVPVAIRAGGARNSQVLKNLRHIAGAAATLDVTAAVNDEAFRNQTARLTAEQERLKKYLDTGTPRVVTDSWRAAVKAYSDARKTEQGLARREAELREAFSVAGFATVSPESGAEEARRFRSWLERLPKLRADAERNEVLRSEKRTRATAAAAERGRACEGLGRGLPSSADWSWLLAAGGPEAVAAWAERLRDHLAGGSPETKLAASPWAESFDTWSGEADAAEWASRSVEFRKEIAKTLEQVRPAVGRVAAAQAKLEAASAALEKRCGLHAVRTDAQTRQALATWEGTFKEEVSSPPTSWDFLPWSKRAKRGRTLRQIEVQLRALFPMTFWSSIGSLESSGRTLLGAAVEEARAWLDASDANGALGPDRIAIEGALGQLRSGGGPLVSDPLPATIEEQAWRELSHRLELQEPVARKAAEAWRLRTIRENEERELRQFASEATGLLHGNPLVDAWRKGPGLPLVGALETFSAGATPAAVVECRRALAAQPIESLLRSWTTARSAEEKRRAAEDEAASIPPEPKLVASWWGDRPKILADEADAPESIPADDGVLHHRYRALETCVGNWATFWSKESPQELKKIEGSHARARTSLADAVNRALEVGHDPKIEALKRFTHTGTADWDVGEVERAFRGFSTEGLRARVEGLAARLESLSFHQAKKKWKDRITAGTASALKATQRLAACYEKNLLLPASESDTFKEALGAAPIWIVTAQATQSIPLVPGLFDLVVIDEASQCTLTNLLPLVFRGKRLAVIGDPKQLPAIPTVQPGEEQVMARQFGVEDFVAAFGHATNNVYRSAEQALPKGSADVLWLREHFRSHPLVIGFSNRHIYQKSLVLRRDPQSNRDIPGGSGVHARRVAGEAERGDNGRSWRNHAEAMECVALAKQVLQAAPSMSVGIVTPFAAQEDLLRTLLDKAGLGDVLAGTAHKFQGDERDVVLFSPVAARGMTDSSIRFIQEPPNLLNVAVTRAREAVFLVGDVDFLARQIGLLGDFTKYALLVEKLRATSLAELELFGWLTMRGLIPDAHVREGDIEIDFVLKAPGRKVAIEVDGDVEPAKDDARDAYLVARGYSVLHFPAADVYERPESVLQEIEKELGGGGA